MSNQEFGLFKHEFSITLFIVHLLRKVVRHSSKYAYAIRFLRRTHLTRDQMRTSIYLRHLLSYKLWLRGEKGYSYLKPTQIQAFRLFPVLQSE